MFNGTFEFGGFHKSQRQLRQQQQQQRNTNKKPNKKLYERLPTTRHRKAKTLPGNHFLENKGDRRGAGSDLSATSSDDEEVFELRKILPKVHDEYPSSTKKRPTSNSSTNSTIGGVATRHKNYDSQNSSWHLHDFIVKKIENGDTLQTIAMRYGCKVSELKRANNIISDQEFYGFVSIRIPVKAFSVLFENSEPGTSGLGQNLKQSNGQQQGKGTNRSNDNNNGNGEYDEIDKGPVEILSLSITDQINGSSEEDGQRFLSKMDKDLENIRSSLKTRKDTLEEAAQVLSDRRFYPITDLQIDRKKSEIYKNWKLWLLVLVIVLVVPFVSVLIYFLKHGPKLKH